MSHIRRQVREAVGSVLSASKVSYNHVFESRIPPARDVLPYVMVYVESETDEPLTIHPTITYQRDLFLVTRAHVRIADNESVEDKMDAVSAEIESKLTYSALDTELSSMLKLLAMTDYSSEVITDENERTYAVITLNWRLVVYTTEGDAETLI